MKMLCIDGNSLINRAFYAIKILTTKDGRYTNAIFGFMNMFLKVLGETEADEVCVAFDLPGPTVRHERYDQYKAHRKGMPEELAQQLPVLQQLLRDLGYAVVSSEGYEADDILGTIAKYCDARAERCFLATGDRDSLQLVSGNTSVLLTTTQFGRGETTLIDPQKIRDDYGIEPAQFIDVKALMGDSSDNIPGVAGVGEKTALLLIRKFTTLEGVYENIDSPDIKPGVRAKLEKDKDIAFLSRELATIITDVPISLESDEYKKSGGDPVAAATTLASLEMHGLVDKLGLKGVAIAPPSADAAPKTEVCAVEAEPLTPEQLEKQEKLCVVFVGESYYAAGESTLFLLDKTSLRALLESRYELCCYDAKLFYKLGCSLGFSVNNIVFDIKLAAYLLNPSSSNYDLPRLAAEYGVAPAFSCGELEEPGLLWPLWAKLEQALKDQDMLDLLQDIELPLSGVLAEMETAGFLVDVKGLSEFGDELKAQIEREQDSVFELVGHKFNLNSPKQLGEALFDTLGLPPGKKTKSGYSTDAETLERLRGAHPAIEHILDYRIYQKLNSTYVDSLIAVADKSGRIHSDFKQTETRTGRISSTNPNLQNIPVRTELGGRMRKYFIAGEGNVLLDADYSQIELRVLASISGDERMISAFLDDRDIHTETAAEIFKLPRDMITPELRRRAKAVNFGIVYGIGAFSLAQDTGVSLSEARDYIEGYMNTYQGVKRYLDETVAQAQQDGYVTTMYGRRRPLPELASSNKQVQALGKRLAMNTPIQGAAADIIKIAMIRVERRLRAEGLAAELILQVHDELIIESKQSDAEAAAAILKQEMEHAAELKAPLVADVGEGASWYDAK